MERLLRIPLDGLEQSMHTLEKIQEEISRPITRFDWQRSLEQGLAAFNADANEAMELLDALTAALKSRYDEGQLADVAHEALQLREALDELDRTLCSQDALLNQDQGYDDE